MLQNYNILERVTSALQNTLDAEELLLFFNHPFAFFQSKEWLTPCEVLPNISGMLQNITILECKTSARAIPSNEEEELLFGKQIWDQNTGIYAMQPHENIIPLVAGNGREAHFLNPSAELVQRPVVQDRSRWDPSLFYEGEQVGVLKARIG